MKRVGTQHLRTSLKRSSKSAEAIGKEAAAASRVAQADDVLDTHARQAAAGGVCPRRGSNV